MYDERESELSLEPQRNRNKPGLHGKQRRRYLESPAHGNTRYDGQVLQSTCSGISEEQPKEVVRLFTPGRVARLDPGFEEMGSQLAWPSHTVGRQSLEVWKQTAGKKKCWKQ